MDTILLLSAIDISDSIRRTTVKITPVKMKVDLNSSDYETHHSVTKQFGDVPAYSKPGRQSMWMYQQCTTWMNH